MNPGRYTNLSNSEYHSGPGISKSGLDRLAVTPEHYKAWLEDERETDSKALRIGTATHMAVLEPELFAERYARFDDTEICFKIGGAKPRATKEYKEWKAAYDAEHGGQIVLPGDEYGEVVKVADSVRSRVTPKKLLSVPGAAEHSFYWNDAETGVLCRCRPDFLREDGYLIDLKTTEDASPRAFERSAENFRYHVQAAFYMRGLEAIFGEPVKGFIFIVVEKTPPYAVACYSADVEMIEAGNAEVDRCLRLYKTCLETDEWPGYPDEILPLTRPSWASYSR